MPEKPDSDPKIVFITDKITPSAPKALSGDEGAEKVLDTSRQEKLIEKGSRGVIYDNIDRNDPPIRSKPKTLPDVEPPSPTPEKE